MVQPIGPRPWTQPFRPLTPPPHKSGDPPITSEGFYMSSHHANGRARKTEAFLFLICHFIEVTCAFGKTCYATLTAAAVAGGLLKKLQA